MKLELVTLTGVALDRDVYEVALSTESGEIAVFPGHEPLVTLLRPGVIAVRLRKGDGDEAMEVFASSGGIAEVSADRVRILVDDAENSDDISEDQARAALERAEKLRADAGSAIEIEKAQATIDRSNVRLRVAGLRRRKH